MGLDKEKHKIKMDSKKRYKTLKKTLPKNYFVRTIKPFVPTITEDDYTLGYIQRYFVQKANDKNSIIYEISPNTFNTLLANVFFKTVRLNWKISGTDDEIKTVNKKVLIYASKTIPAITLYLPNLLQFSKNNLGI